MMNILHQFGRFVCLARRFAHRHLVLPRRTGHPTPPHLLVYTM